LEYSPELAVERGCVWRKGMKKYERKGNKKNQKKLKTITDEIKKERKGNKKNQKKLKNNHR